MIRFSFLMPSRVFGCDGESGHFEASGRHDARAPSARGRSWTQDPETKGSGYGPVGGKDAPFCSKASEHRRLSKR